MISRQAYGRWKEQLLAAMTSLTNLSPQGKLGYFKRFAGKELLVVLDSLELREPATISATPFEDALSKLDRHFNSEENNILARMNFAVAEQLPDEGNIDYLSRMLSDVKWCGFPTDRLEFELILGVATNASNEQIRTAAARVGCTFLELRSLAAALDLRVNIEKQKAKKKSKAGINAVAERQVAHQNYDEGSGYGNSNRFGQQTEYRQRYEPYQAVGMSSRNPARAQLDDRQAYSYGKGYESQHMFKPRNLGNPHRSQDKCLCCGFQGHEAAACRKKFEECRNCRQQGHLIRMCPRKALRVAPKATWKNNSKQEGYKNGRQFSVTDEDKVNASGEDSDDQINSER